MTPATAITNAKRKYRRRRESADPCPKCGSEFTRFYGRYGRKRYAKCQCGKRWVQFPKDAA